MGSCISWPCFRGVGSGEEFGTIRVACTLVYTFIGLQLGGSHPKERGDHRKKKFFINNSVEALIPFNEEHQDLLKLQVLLGWEWGDRVRDKGWDYLQESGRWSGFLLVDSRGSVVILGSAYVEIFWGCGLLRLNPRAQGEHLTSQLSWAAA